MTINTQRVGTADQLSGKLIKLAAEMALGVGMPSDFDEDWRFSKSTPRYVRADVLSQAGKALDQCKLWAMELRSVADELSARSRAGLETAARHEVGCKLLPDPHDEREPVGPCTCKHDVSNGAAHADGCPADPV